MAFYDTQWKKLPFYYGYPQIQKNISKPNKLLQMLKIAEILAEGFPHVRVVNSGMKNPWLYTVGIYTG